MRSVVMLMPVPLPELSSGGARFAPLTNQMRLAWGLDIISRIWPVLTFLFFVARARIFLRVYEASLDDWTIAEVQDSLKRFCWYK